MITTLRVVVAILTVTWMSVLRADDKSVASQRIPELEKTIAVLRADNAALRQQLVEFTAMKSKASAANSHTAERRSPTTVSQPDAVEPHWLSGSGKRHNKNCRYFGTGSGHPCGPEEGVACKICGG